jgi:nitrogen regulatory protein PII
MQTVKRVEIVTDAREMRQVCAVLEAQGVTGYSIVRDVIGKGERGIQSGDELTDVFKNSYLLTTCSAEKVADLVEAIRPLLKKRGGVCLVSDALWVKH